MTTTPGIEESGPRNPAPTVAYDPVDHPPHYGGDTVYETIKVLEAWLAPAEFIGFLRGNALKYLSRAGGKGKVEEDLKKAQWYGRYEFDYRRRLEQGLTGNARAMLVEAAP